MGAIGEFEEGVGGKPPTLTPFRGYNRTVEVYGDEADDDGTHPITEG